MAEPIIFPSSTPNAGLPLLFSGQSQKEFFINHAVSIIDALKFGTICDVLSEPPAWAMEGQCYLVGQNASAGWAGQEDKIACHVGDSWHFIDPIEGMRLFDQASGQMIFFSTQWVKADAVAEPGAGAVIDVEARAAINAIISALGIAGLVPGSS